MVRSDDMARYENACAFLPKRLRSLALAVPDWQKERAQELRLRVGAPMTLLLSEGETAAAQQRQEGLVTAADLEQMIASATEYSRYASLETLRCGYLTLRGGYRLGVCGTASVREGECCNLHDFSSCSLRIVHEKRGIAEETVRALWDGRCFPSTLILSPPGGGKTTLLRDMIRALSEGAEDRAALRVAVIDERCEIALSCAGEAQTELGAHTDVLSSCPKSAGIAMLLRGMNPQLIAVDEITQRTDISAMCDAANCGVALLATIHAGEPAELLRKPLYRELADACVFTKYVLIRRSGGKRVYETGELPCCGCSAEG